MEEYREPISSRLVKLNQLFFERTRGNVTSHYLISRDGLIDALFALYDECNNEYMRKDKSIASFLNKFCNVVKELHHLQVNISDFEVKKIIGRGHFGEVQVVREKVTGDVYAMKVLRKSNMLSQESVAFYEEERDIMAKANSPWITKLQYAFQDKLHLYLVMEFHPGGDMLSLLANNDNQLPEDTARFYLAELVLAIQSVHNMGYVHRDIKPDNVLLDRTGHIKLADFGSVAKLGADKMVLSKMPVGSPDYIAPEVLMAMNSYPASSAKYGVECDWWSLGIVAYEMLFGQTPFSDEKVLHTYNNIMNFKKSLSFSEDLGNVSNAAVDLIKGLLQERSTRWGYQQLYVNLFFIDIDWDNIRQTAPPYVPDISGEDDTSNFDEFEFQAPCPSAADVKSIKEFNGKNLPFIGFTYSSCNTVLDRTSVCMDSSVASLNVTAVDENKKEIQKIAMLEEKEATLKKTISELQSAMKEKEKYIKVIDIEKNCMQNTMTEMESEVQGLRRFLDIERKDRTVTEEKALEIMKVIKENYKKKEHLITAELKNCIERKDHEIMQLKEKLHKTETDSEKNKKQMDKISEELEENKKLLCEYRDKVNKTYGYKRDSITGFQKLNNQALEQVTNLQAQLTKTETEKSEIQMELEVTKNSFAKTETEINILKEENNAAWEQVDGLKKVIFKLESELRKMDMEEQLAAKSDHDQQKNDLETKIEILMATEEENKIQLALQKKQLSEEHESKERLLNDREELEFTLQEEKIKYDDMNKQFKLKEEQLESKLQISEEQVKGLKSHIEKLEKDIHNLQEKEFELNNVVSELNSKISKAEMQQKEFENENSDLKKQQQQLNNNNVNENKVRKSLDVSNLQQENAYFSTKLGQVEIQLDKVRENLGKQRLKTEGLQQQLRKKESELSETQIDLRIALREAKQAEDIVGGLRDSNRSLREKANNLEKIKVENEAKQKSLMEEIAQLKQQLEDTNKEFETESRNFETEKANLEGKLKSLKEVCGDTNDVKEKYAKSVGKYEELSEQMQIFQDQIKQKEDEKQQLLNDMNNLKNKFLDKGRECEVLELNLNTLKSVCTELEDQLHVLEILVETHEENEAKLKKQRDSSYSEIDKLEEDIRNTQELLAKEKRNRVEKELLLEEVQDELQCETALHETELKALTDQLMQQREMCKEYTDQILGLEKKLSVLEAVKTTMEKGIGILEEENIKVKEEASKHITQISSFKQSNLKLTYALEEATAKCEEIKEAYEQTYSDLESTKVSHENEKLKLQQTLHQQTKLIDFLQAKTEGMGRRHKGMLRFFTGKKESIPCVPLQYKDLEVMLEKERSKCRRLQEQLNKSRAEILECRTEFGRNYSTAGLNPTFTVPVSPASRAVLSVLTQSPGGGGRSNALDSPLIVTDEMANVIQKPQSERMRHSIPHRFQDWLCMHGRKCAACLDTIHFGRHASKCQECEVICHPKCASSLPNTCSLPSGYVEHFTNTLQNKDKSLYQKGMKSMWENESVTVQANKVEGWIKIPRNGRQGWERHYAVLDETKIYIFDKGETREIPLSSVSTQIELCPSDGEITVSSAVSATELIGTAKSDLPYVLKVEYKPHTTCWPPKCYYIMTQNFSEKQLWVSALETITQECKDETDQNLESKLLDCCILKQTKDLWEINTICAISEKLALLGAKEGFYAIDVFSFTSKNVKCKIGNTHHVYQVSVSHQLNLVVTITGEEREVWMFDLHELENYIKISKLDENFNTRPVGNLKNCHLFAVSDDVNIDAVFMCAANEKTVILLKWSLKLNLFLKVKEWSFPETCSCILFTKNTVILGADKFYEIDLKDYSIEDFLDPSDVSLSFLIYGASLLNSFPIAVFQVAPSENPPEYLLCFHELGVFVDCFGRRSRDEEVKWKKLPLAFAFRTPYLFVMHFNSVEAIQISGKNKMIYSSIPVHNPQYLGNSLSNNAIYVCTKNDKEQKVLCIKGSFINEEVTSEKVDDNITQHSRCSYAGSDGSGDSFATSLWQSLVAQSTDNLSVWSDLSKTSTEEKDISL